MTVSLQRHRIN